MLREVPADRHSLNTNEATCSAAGGMGTWRLKAPTNKEDSHVPPSSRLVLRRKSPQGFGRTALARSGSEGGNERKAPLKVKRLLETGQQNNRVLLLLLFDC